MFKERVQKIFACVLMTLSLTFYSPNPAKADLFGGDVVVLTQILANAIQQLIRLKEIVGTARNNLSLLKDINRGISEALNLIRTIYPEQELQIYKDWESFEEALKKAEEIYGHAVNSKDAAAQGHLDRSIVEAIILYNKVSKHSKRVDLIGENIKNASMGASPKGAARLSAQAAGVSLHVQNQSLRTQNALLKLEAQNSAIRNKKDKDETRFYLESSRKLKEAMKKHDPKYKTPRF